MIGGVDAGNRKGAAVVAKKIYFLRWEIIYKHGNIPNLLHSKSSEEENFCFKFVTACSVTKQIRKTFEMPSGFSLRDESTRYLVVIKILFVCVYAREINFAISRPRDVNLSCTRRTERRIAKSSLQRSSRLSGKYHDNAIELYTALLCPAKGQAYDRASQHQTNSRRGTSQNKHSFQSINFPTTQAVLNWATICLMGYKKKILTRKKAVIKSFVDITRNVTRTSEIEACFLT